MNTASMITLGMDPFAASGLQAGLSGYLAVFVAGALLVLLAAMALTLLRRRHQRTPVLRWERPDHLAQRRPWDSGGRSTVARLCRRMRPSAH